jgi:2-polyprenyl-3-methyl-5-hydroxy-6-metoxy-1,4-benzoquinol methylase
MSIISAMSRIGILNENRLEQFYPKVRDRDDISVMRDKQTDVIVLSSSEHVSSVYYEEREEGSSHCITDGDAIVPKLADNLRRKKHFGSYIQNKHWLDFGCGLGGALDEMAQDALWAAGLELNRQRTAIVAAKGHNVISSLAELKPASLDVITMFHVLEHLEDPLTVLSELFTRLKPGGVLLIEVPHARDALITLYDCEAFKRFTFWSEHLILHTRQSLKILLEHCRFRSIEILGHQRYPLANHLYWLCCQRPGGHDKWRFLSNSSLDNSYEDSLAMIDRTDTLIAVCTLN